MIIGVPKEIKKSENRVALTPGGAFVLVTKGNEVIVETNAGEGSGFTDDDYISMGAKIAKSAVEAYSKSEAIYKVKEPLEDEFDLLRPGQVIYTYLHLAPNEVLTRELLKRKVTSIAYETVQLDNGKLPLLAPMSEVAGRMSIQIGANLLQKLNGGAGILLGGVPGVKPASVTIIGGGVVGTNAAKIALGMGANVSIINANVQRLRELDDIFSGRVNTLVCNPYNVARQVPKTDLLIGAVLVAGAKAPTIVTEEMVKTMKKGTVIVDVAVDQGGCVETIDRITYHDNPYYVKHGVIHYAVANMPGAVPQTATLALEAATLPYMIQIADKGIHAALLEDESLLKGLNTYNGRMTCEGVAESFNMEYTNPRPLLAANIAS